MNDDDNKTTFFNQAFSRCNGLIMDDERMQLQNKCVGVAGLGGVGGGYVLTLARMGIGKFNISDCDSFELANMNRQSGATMSSLGMSKLETINKMALDINPYLTIKKFSEGIQKDNVDEFVSSSDVILDAIDFFSPDSHRLLHQEARLAKKPVVFCVPVGFSGTLHVFHPEGMSFDDYFNFNAARDYFDLLILFSLGIAPHPTHLLYMNISGEALANKTPPSVASACSISNGLAATEVVVLLLNKRNPVFCAPQYIQFDSLRQLFRKGSLRYGNKGLFQQLKFRIMSKRFESYRERINKLV